MIYLCLYIVLLYSIVHDVIDINNGDNDDDNLAVLAEIAHKHDKGKALEAVHEDVLGKAGVLTFARARRKRAAASSLTITDEPENETLRKLGSFKQFDTISDTSDHYFIKSHSSMAYNREEWKILEKHLPDTIFVRVCESRMDLMRAVIIGAKGTPYHDSLFFFDVYFPPGYPNEPPQVHYHSGGLGLNPNLYSSGYVCLSLLGTWEGDEDEMWTPGVSTMLQVLVSIQGLILNAKPYFNEPEYERASGSPDGEKRALQYNEDTFILSLRTMTYMIRSPPKNFEDLVVGHFYSRAHDILGSCKAYTEGVQVGCFVKGGVENVNKGKRNCSSKFKTDLVEYVKILVTESERIGVKDCEKFTA
ncbi:putative ubiquitin-conjugating enzyme E2 38 [Medicago truncatula]|uniref:putative ubiquitin-conjugating enzyme E2 38 n=1 Tax=Medicago truncatula TaxID=3880 RepID=UPI00196722DA|nr:putative ubiquitin-conjugating enzyme E2 38 [Medicago truncatula]